MTRIIGYLKRVSNFSKARQEEAHRRYYDKEKVVESVER
jgi:ribonucleoside-triphosphate reductase